MAETRQAIKITEKQVADPKDLEKCQKEISALKKEVEKLKNEKKKEEEARKTSEEKLITNTAEEERKRKSLAETIQKFEIEKKKLENEYMELENDKKELERKLSERDGYIYDLKKQVKVLTEELDFLKRKTFVQVQVLPQHSGEVMQKTAGELAAAISAKKKETEIDVLHCMKATDLQPGLPVLLLCIGTPGIQQTIENALKGLSVASFKKMAVVIVHLKVENALPMQPSDRVLDRKSTELLGGIYDIGFMSDIGLYKCQFNEANLTSIVNFIYRVGEKKPKVK